MNCRSWKTLATWPMNWNHRLVLVSLPKRPESEICPRAIARYFCGVLAFVLIVAGGQIQAQEKAFRAASAATLLPDSVVAVAEIPQLGQIATIVWDHPLRQRLLDLPVYQAMLQSEPFKLLKQGVNAFETTMGQPWLSAIQKLTDGGITFALDSQHGPGVALLIRSTDQSSIEKFREFTLAVRLLVGGGKLVEQADYRGLTAYALDKNLKMVAFDNWILFTNQNELGKAILDRFLDGKGASLQSNERYQQSLTSRPNPQRSPAGSEPPTVASAFVDLEKLRSTGVAKELFADRIDNFVGELVLGGLLTNVRRAPYADIELSLSPAKIGLLFSTKHQREWEPPREYTFGTPELAISPPLIEIPSRVFALSAHRDMSQMWLRAGELLTENAEEQLAQADTQLTTFFSGRDFGEDILGALESDMHLVVGVQDFANQLPRPAIELPCFAFEFRLKNVEESRSDLRRIFQSFVGFLNITGAMTGQPPLDLGMESIGDAQFYTSQYVPNRGEEANTKAPLQFNFSPTIAFADERFILSSTTALARDLAQRDSQSHSPDSNQSDGPDAAHDSQANTRAALDIHSLRTVLKANESQLVANNMLEEGHTQEQAMAEIELLLELMGYLQQADLKLEYSDARMDLRFGLELVP